MLKRGISRFTTATPSKGQLVITNQAVQKLKSISHDAILRVSIDSGGCHGFSYNIALDSKINNDDVVFQNDETKVVVDAISLDIIKGSTLDYQEQLIGSSFQIVDNPAASSSCGFLWDFLSLISTKPNETQQIMPKIEGISVFIIAALVSPYIPIIFPWISAFGIIILLFFLLGFIIHYPPKSRIDNYNKFSRYIPGTGLLSTEISQPAVIDSTLKLNDQPNSLQNTISNSISRLFIKYSSEKLLSGIYSKLNIPRETAISLDAFKSVITPKATEFANYFMDWYIPQKSNHFEQKIWISISKIILKHIKQYKRIRREVLRDNFSSIESRKFHNIKINHGPSTSASKLSSSESAFINESEESFHHLDEYNYDETTWDYNDNQSFPDPNVPLPRNNLEELNNQISQRMSLYGIIHPAIGNVEQEKSYVRLIVDQLWNISPLGQISQTSPNNFFKILCRELVSCKYIWPAIDKLTQPDFLNQLIIERSQRRLITQKAVRGFRGNLEAYFTQFPPKFLQKTTLPKLRVLSLGQKFRYFEGLSKYAKKCTSLFDLNAIRHEILFEMRKRLEETQDLQTKGADEKQIENLKRYLKSLDSVRLKYEKSIRILTTENSKMMLGIVNENVPKSKNPPTLSLQMLLDEYQAYTLGEEKRLETSPSLFYFLNYMEKENLISNAKFWLAVEKLKKMMISTKLSGINSAMEDEMTKIFKLFMVPSASGDPIIEISDSTVMSSLKEFLSLKNQGLVIQSVPLELAYKGIVKAQNLVYNKLNDSFKSFLESDLYFKLISDIESSKISSCQGSEPMLNESFAFSKNEHNENKLNLQMIPKIQDSSLILRQLSEELENESERLTGAKVNKGGRERKKSFLGEGGLFSTIDDILDVDIISNLEADPFLENFEKKELQIATEGESSGEFLLSSTKLQQIKEDIERNLLEIDCLSLIQAKAPPPHIVSSPMQQMKAYILEQTLEIIRQEINDLTRQKIKLESQEQKDAILPGACTIKIKNSIEEYIGESEKRRVTFYVITIQKDLDARTWSVKRRYNDFHSIHKKLKERFPFVAELDLPGKTLGGIFTKFTKEELKKERMMALETYLQKLTDNPSVCQSDELRTFLSSEEYKSKYYQTIKSIIDAPEETITTAATAKIKSGAFKLAKMVETAGRRSFNFTAAQFKKKKSRETLRAKKSNGQLDISNTSFKNIRLQELSDMEKSDGNLSSEGSEDWGSSSDEALTGEDENYVSVGQLADPICNLLIELFDLKEHDHDLKQNASAMLLRQLIGSQLPLDKEIENFLCRITDEENLIKHISMYTDKLVNKLESVQTFDKEGFSTNDSIPRTISEQQASKIEARAKLISAWPDAFSRSLGVESTSVSVGRIFDLCQSSILNRHLIFTLMDALLYNFTTLEEYD